MPAAAMLGGSLPFAAADTRSEGRQKVFIDVANLRQEPAGGSRSAALPVPECSMRDT